MLVTSFAFFSLAVLMGALLLAGRLQKAPVVHGASGAIGLALLIRAWWRGILSGPFALDAIVLLSAGFCGGLLIALLHRQGRPSPGLLLFLHASAGGLAYLLLAGFVFGH